MVVDAFKTIEAPCEGFLREKASKFHAFAFPVSCADDIEQRLSELQKVHPKATHHCYAWRLGTDGDSYRANDDGEPAGTAGRPILGQIDSFGLTNVLIVVVRYYGGTKLGASGLIAAYKDSAKDALEQANIIEKFIEEELDFQVSYNFLNALLILLAREKVQIVGQDFSGNPIVKCLVRMSAIEKLTVEAEKIQTCRVVGE